MFYDVYIGLFPFGLSNNVMSMQCYLLNMENGFGVSGYLNGRTY